LPRKQQADLLRRFQSPLDRAETLEYLDVAERGIAAIEMAAQVHLSR
jgi:hypothetical protein